MNYRLKIGYVSVALFGFMFMAAQSAHAATSPDLGAADSYSVLSGAEATNGGDGVTTISGNLGVSPAASYNDTAGTPTVFLTAGNPHLADGSAADAQAAQKAVFDGPLDFVDQPCTVTYVVHTELSTLGPLNPGVYCTGPEQDFTLSGTLTLNGTGDPTTDVWIFRSSRDVIGSGPANVVFTGTGGLPCNVWWRVANTATFTANNAMVGNILAATDITFGQSATLDGRAFAYTGTVALLGNTISGPTCVVAAAAPSSITAAPLIHVTKVPNPLALPEGPGSVTFTYAVTNPGPIQMTNITLVDDKCPGMTYISGDVNGDTWLQRSETWVYRCTTTLFQTSVNYATARGLGNGLASVDTAITQVVVGVPVIPPLINVVKTAIPLTLPFNGGSVTYNYAVTNPGTVELTDVTVTDDKCGGVVFESGDVNGDDILQVNETWRYSCTTNIPLTTTNTAIATGSANGLTAIDTSLATVIVEGSPVPPPLIHIIKKPEPVVLPVGGGVVTYTYNVLNPGVIPLNDVSVADNVCGPVTFVSGDTNNDGLLDPNETWIYTCQQRLTATTTNTATAQGSGNSLAVADVSLATVVLSAILIPPAPSLPVTGFNPGSRFILLAIFAGVFAAAALLFLFLQRKRIFNRSHV